MNDDDPTPLIARRLRDERARRGWTLDDLARRAGVSKAMLSKLERCEASPTAALLGRISGALGMTLSTLLAADDAPGGAPGAPRRATHLARPATPATCDARCRRCPTCRCS